MPLDTVRVREDVAMAVTKLRNFRVDDALWAQAQAIAGDRRETLSAVLKRALVDYVETHGGDITREGREFQPMATPMATEAANDHP